MVPNGTRDPSCFFPKASSNNPAAAPTKYAKTKNHKLLWAKTKPSAIPSFTSPNPIHRPLEAKY